MSNSKAIIFDFNGTLFWDSKLHDLAWRSFAETYNNRAISDEEMIQNVYGRINRDILSFIFGRDLLPEEIEKYALIKEKAYRELVASESCLHVMAPGAVDYLNFLIEKKIPITIATSSNKDNVDFFFEHLQLEQWFDYNLVVMEDESMEPKPAPDIFIKAANNLGVSPKSCLVIEDSLTGIISAKNADIGKIILMENNSPIDFSLVKDMVYKRINSFTELMLDYYYN